MAAVRQACRVTAVTVMGVLWIVSVRTWLRMVAAVGAVAQRKIAEFRKAVQMKITRRLVTLILGPRLLFPLFDPFTNGTLITMMMTLWMTYPRRGAVERMGEVNIEASAWSCSTIGSKIFFLSGSSRRCNRA